MCCGVVLASTGDLGSLEGALRGLEPVREEVVDRLEEILKNIEDGQAQTLHELACNFGNDGVAGTSGNHNIIVEPPTKGMRDVEKRLLPLFSVDHVRQRLRLVRLKSSLPSQQARIIGVAKCFAEAAIVAQKSTMLKDLMHSALRLRDYVQRGPEALNKPSGPTRAMDIGSLLSSMLEFKSLEPTAGKMNLLQFFARSLLRVRPDFDTRLEEQLLELRAAMRHSWTTLHEDLKHIQAETAFVEKEAEEHANDYGPSGSAATTSLEQLASDAPAAMAASMDAVEAANTALRGLASYFGVNNRPPLTAEKEPAGVVVLKHLTQLLDGFCRACAEVRNEQTKA